MKNRDLMIFRMGLGLFLLGSFLSILKGDVHIFLIITGAVAVIVYAIEKEK